MHVTREKQLRMQRNKEGEIRTRAGVDKARRENQRSLSFFSATVLVMLVLGYAYVRDRRVTLTGAKTEDREASIRLLGKVFRHRRFSHETGTASAR